MSAPSSQHLPLPDLVRLGLDALAAGDLTKAQTALAAVVDDARAPADPQSLQAAAEMLERIGDYPAAWKGLDLLGQLNAPPGPPDWKGESLAGRTLLIEQRLRHTGAVIRMARLIAIAAKQADRCIVLVEPRLKPLFERSFPEAECLDAETGREAAYAQCDVRASYETLCRYLADSDEAIEAGFQPLQADPARTAVYRARYMEGAAPETKLVGISWRSMNPDKDILTLAQWADLLPRLRDARFVSIQYGEARQEANEIASASGNFVILDPEADQFANLDDFTAQVAALDAIVSISNTACHVAGALGIPSIVLTDQRPALIWNIRTERQAWYPRTSTIRHDGEDWPAYRKRILAAVVELTDLRTLA